MLHDGKGEHLRWHRNDNIVPVAHLGASGQNAHVRAINARGQVELRFAHPNHTSEGVAERKPPACKFAAASELVVLRLTTFKVDIHFGKTRELIYLGQRGVKNKPAFGIGGTRLGRVV